MNQSISLYSLTRTICIVSLISFSLTDEVAAQSQAFLYRVSGSPCVGSEQIFAFIWPDGNCQAGGWSVQGGGTIVREGQNTVTVVWSSPTTNASVYGGGWCGGASTGPFTVSARTPPSVTLAPVSEICHGRKFQATAYPQNAGSSPLFTWYVDNIKVAEGYTTTQDIFTESLAPGLHSIYVDVRSSWDCTQGEHAVSPTATFTVRQKASYTVKLYGPTVCANAPSAGYRVDVENRVGDLGTLSYQFYRNGNQVMTDAVDVLMVQNANMGDQVYCVVSSSASCVIPPVQTTTHTLQLLPTQLPGLGMILPKTNYCSGETMNLDVTSTGITTSSTYRWTLDGQVFSTNKKAELGVSTDPQAHMKFSPGDVIRVEVTGLSGQCVSDGINSIDSRYYTINVRPVTDASISIALADNEKICPNASITTTTVNAGDNPRFTWYVDALPEATSVSSSYAVNALAAGSHNVRVKLTSSIECTQPFTTPWKSFRINQNPQVNAGADRSIEAPEEAYTIVGSVSDPDDTPVVRWTQLSGKSLSMSQANTSSLVLPFAKIGAYGLRLTATDQCGSISDDMILTVTPPFNNHNYIITNSVQVPGVTDAQLVGGLSADRKNQSIQYYDGLGRPMQAVATQGSPSGKDVVVPTVYDPLGREALKYLPFVSAETNGFYKEVGYADNKDYVHDFYDRAGDAVINDNRPFSEIVFEKSPLSRPLKEYGPGESWGPAQNNKFLQHTYGANVFSNANEKIIAWTVDAAGLPVRRDPVDGHIEPGGFYATGQLRVKASRDEAGNEVREYTTKDNKIILKKVQALSSASLTVDDHWAQTYYIYDDAGNLSLVLSPEATKELIR